jgi:hypothetical protein
VPAARAVVVNVATPAVSDPVPMVVVPSMNLTVSPFAGVPAVELTVAVRATAPPKLEGFAEEAIVVVVEAFNTLWLCDEVLARKFPSPE